MQPWSMTRPVSGEQVMADDSDYMYLRHIWPAGISAAAWTNDFDNQYWQGLVHLRWNWFGLSFMGENCELKYRTDTLWRCLQHNG